jgi:hypothetical protein
MMAVCLGECLYDVFDGRRKSQWLDIGTEETSLGRIMLAQVKMQIIVHRLAMIDIYSFR